MHRSTFKLSGIIIENVINIKTWKERQGDDYISAWEGTRGYPLQHHVCSTQEKRGPEHTTRHSLTSTSESESGHLLSVHTFQRKRHQLWTSFWRKPTAAHCIKSPPQPTEMGLGTAACGWWEIYLLGCMFTYCNAFPYSTESGAHFCKYPKPGADLQPQGRATPCAQHVALWWRFPLPCSPLLQNKAVLPTVPTRNGS